VLAKNDIRLLVLGVDIGPFIAVWDGVFTKLPSLYPLECEPETQTTKGPKP
jgi:hypothetical protein